MVRITFKEAQFTKYKNIVFKWSEDGIEYYRPEIPVYVVRRWNDNGEFTEQEFKTLKSAQRFIKQKHLTADINYYVDIADRYWKKQYQYTNGVLTGEDENV